MSRRAATTTTSIFGASSSVGLDAADDAVVEDGLVERHRDLLLGLEADRRVELLRVLDRRQAQGADDDALVGDAEPDPLGELVLGEEGAQGVGERVGVDDLAVLEGVGGEGRDRGRRNSASSRSPRTSVAAMLPASISRPTRVFSFLVC